MGKNDRCAVGACNNARMYPDKQVVKDHISAFDTSLQLRFWKCKNPELYDKWASACNRKDFKFGKHNVVCSNHFQYGRPTDVSSTPTMYLKGYNEEVPMDINENKAVESSDAATDEEKDEKKSTTQSFGNNSHNDKSENKILSKESSTVPTDINENGESSESAIDEEKDEKELGNGTTQSFSNNDEIKNKILSKESLTAVPKDINENKAGESSEASTDEEKDEKKSTTQSFSNNSHNDKSENKILSKESSTGSTWTTKSSDKVIEQDINSENSCSEVIEQDINSRNSCDKVIEQDINSKNSCNQIDLVSSPEHIPDPFITDLSSDANSILPVGMPSPEEIITDIEDLSPTETSSVITLGDFDINLIDNTEEENASDLDNTETSPVSSPKSELEKSTCCTPMIDSDKKDKLLDKDVCTDLSQEISSVSSPKSELEKRTRCTPMVELDMKHKLLDKKICIDLSKGVSQSKTKSSEDAYVSDSVLKSDVPKPAPAPERITKPNRKKSILAIANKLKKIVEEKEEDEIKIIDPPNNPVPTCIFTDIQRQTVESYHSATPNVSSNESSSVRQAKSYLHSQLPYIHQTIEHTTNDVILIGDDSDDDEPGQTSTSCSCESSTVIDKPLSCNKLPTTVNNVILLLDKESNRVSIMCCKPSLATTQPFVTNSKPSIMSIETSTVCNKPPLSTCNPSSSIISLYSTKQSSVTNETHSSNTSLNDKNKSTLNNETVTILSKPIISTTPISGGKQFDKNELCTTNTTSHTTTYVNEVLGNIPSLTNGSSSTHLLSNNSSSTDVSSSTHVLSNNSSSTDGLSSTHALSNNSSGTDALSSTHVLSNNSSSTDGSSSTHVLSQTSDKSDKPSEEPPRMDPEKFKYNKKIAKQETDDVDDSNACNDSNDSDVPDITDKSFRHNIGESNGDKDGKSESDTEEKSGDSDSQGKYSDSGNETQNKNNDCRTKSPVSTQITQSNSKHFKNNTNLLPTEISIETPDSTILKDKVESGGDSDKTSEILNTGKRKRIPMMDKNDSRVLSITIESSNSLGSESKKLKTDSSVPSQYVPYVSPKKKDNASLNKENSKSEQQGETIVLDDD